MAKHIIPRNINFDKKFVFIHIPKTAGDMTDEEVLIFLDESEAELTKEQKKLPPALQKKILQVPMLFPRIVLALLRKHSRIS